MPGLPGGALRCRSATFKPRLAIVGREVAEATPVLRRPIAEAFSPAVRDALDAGVDIGRAGLAPGEAGRWRCKGANDCIGRGCVGEASREVVAGFEPLLSSRAEPGAECRCIGRTTREPPDLATAPLRAEVVAGPGVVVPAAGTGTEAAPAQATETELLLSWTFAGGCPVAITRLPMGARREV